VFLVVVVAVLGLLLAWARGWERLARVRVRAVRLLVVAAVLQVGAATAAPDSTAVRVVALVLTALLVGLFLGGNWRVAGVPLMGLGLLLNSLVVVANIGMPVSVDAAARAGLTRADLHLDHDPLHEAAGPGTHLVALGDVIPVALPWRPQVVSRGDVLVAAGVGQLLVMGAPRRRRRVRPYQGPVEREPGHGARSPSSRSRAVSRTLSREVDRVSSEMSASCSSSRATRRAAAIAARKVSAAASVVCRKYDRPSSALATRSTTPAATRSRTRSRKVVPGMPTAASSAVGVTGSSIIRIPASKGATPFFASSWSKS
jgi:hypothetical protein